MLSALCPALDRDFLLPDAADDEKHSLGAGLTLGHAPRADYCSSVVCEYFSGPFNDPPELIGRTVGLAVSFYFPNCQILLRKCFRSG